MRKIIYILTILILTAGVVNAQQVCCPQFNLVPDMVPCPDSSYTPPIGGQGKDCDLSACKHSTDYYTVLPNKIGYTYTWIVTGGTAASATGNPMKVTWGNGDAGSIKIFITNQDGSCRDTIIKNGCLKDAPVANFSFSPVSPFCLNQTIQFTNTSTGATSYYWDFGDGSSSNQVNPLHNFNSPGTYTILLAVSNKPPSTNPIYPQQDIGMECGCRDTIRKTITVKNASGINIISGCKKMLCKGDTASYCTTNQCSGYSWSVTGGHISGASNGRCITVIWDGTSPATVSLSGNCGGACGNSGTLSVPVLYPSMPINGNTIVCPASFASYSLPSMPGTFYTWQLSGGGTIAGANSNTSVIGVSWGSAAGNYTITCNYHNPITGCSGTSTLTVRVNPKFSIIGPSQSCTGNASSFSVVGGGTANWNISPTTGYIPSGTFNNVSNIGLTWNAAGNYSINAVPVIPANYCTASATINMIVNPIPVLSAIAGPIVICPSQSYNYSVSSNIAGGNFGWAFTSGAGSITAYGNANSSASISFTGTGPWVLQATQTVNGCTGNSPLITINKVPPPPPITISPSGSICSGATVTATVAGGIPVGGYTWSNTPGAVLTGGQGTTSATFTINSNAIISISNCSGNSTLNIATSAATVTITKTSNSCSAILTASPGGGTYQWFLNGNPAGSGNPITVNQNGTYVVQATYAGPCTANSQIVVTGISPIVANISATGNLCSNGSVVLQSGIPANCPGAVFAWSNGATGNPITVTTAGNYFVTISCSNGCSSVSNTIPVIGCSGGSGSCINDLVISASNCNNPVSLTTNIPPGCSPTSTTWSYGDGFNNNTGIHQYTNIGTYTVQATMNCSNGSVHCGNTTITVPMVDSFTHVITCGTNGWIVHLQDASMYLPSYSGYSVTWSTTCGSLSGTTTPNPVLTVPIGCNPVITLSISKNGCNLSKSFTFNFPGTAFSINGPSTVCRNVNNVFSSSFTTGIISYNWNFGDATTAVTNPVTHAFNGTPPNPIVTLLITDQYSCQFTATKNITVVIPRALNIAGFPILKICPDCTPPATLTTSPATGFTGYQWYHNGVAISGANNAGYQLCNFDASGNYYVTATDNLNNNCPVISDTVKVVYLPKPVADIRGQSIQCSATTSGNISLQNSVNDPACTYSWAATGPGSVTFSPNNLQYYANATVSALGTYQFILTVTNTLAGCKSKDTICVTLAQNPAVTINAPAGTLCAGQVYTFTATASPNINPDNYFYQWSNGVSGNTLSTGNPGTYAVFVESPSGCKATAIAGTIKVRPDISLFPVGCDTLCWTDTLRFPLPMPVPSAYSVTWYDDDGTAITNAGNGFILPLSNLQPGIHHLHAIVSFAGSCADTTGILDLYIKDCTLLPPCNNCPGLLGSSSVETENNITNGVGYQLSYNSITFTILKPVKEVRISLSDLQYYWNDSTCNNCKKQMIERGCLFPTAGGVNLGTLVWDDYTSNNFPPNTATDKCPGELVWKNGTPLLPGTYTIPLQLSLPKPAKDNCKLITTMLCFHLTVIDTSCDRCDTRICKTGDNAGGDACKCNAANTWTGLYLLPQKAGIAKPTNLILCNTTITGIITNIPYVLSGVYHCQGKCASTKNEITVYNQVNQVIYTHVTAALNETILFPASGMYSISLAATCGTQKCICSFKLYVTDGKCVDCDTTITAGCKDCPTPITTQIDSVIHQILPPDFNGGILVARNDSVLYEKYVSYKDSVNVHTPFDLASVTKTFTGMAILKLMEEGKLNIDDPVSKYLPEFPIPEITIKMLLSHRSGLEDYLEFMDASGWDKTKNLTNKDLLQFIAGNKLKVLINVPGKVYNYSNTNFALLSLIIEKQSGQSYKDYLSATFFRPLQMNDTYILTPENFASATRSYYKNGKTYPARYLDFITGDKSVYSTVQDLKKWDKALRGGKLFKKTTLDMAYTATSPVTAFTGNYGLGWKKAVTANGKEFIYHTGNWAGNRSILIRLLQENVIIAVVSNNNFTNIAEIRRLCDLFGDYQQSNKKIPNF